MHPDKIGPYLIDRKIGSGGMGNVYHGTHEETGNEAAIKVLPASMAREEGFVLRFSREIDALRKVSSPNVVRLFEDGETEDGSYYFSMEFVDGETLTSMILRRKKVPWPEAIDIAMQIATALKSAHNVGIVHRDLKPSNLIIATDGTVKLADFGVAHVFATTRLTRTGGIVGTAEYMSPEQSRGQRATKLSDIYSLGAVMYVMLTGRPPFTGTLAADILNKHQHAQFDRPRHYVPDLPPLLEDFVCKLLEKKPENRLPDAFVVIRQLTNIRSRIEFSEQQGVETGTQPAGPTSSRTVDGGSDITSGASPHRIQYAPGPATIVRDAIRSDLEAQLRKSPIAKFFDNTLVLIVLLVLVIAVGIFLSRTSAPDPMAEAAVVFEGGPGPPWLRARDDIVQPLLNANQVSAEQREQLQQWLRMADQYEFGRGLTIVSPSDGSADSELQRLVAGAFDTYAAGHVSEARQQLMAVQDILTEDDDYLRGFLATTLERWSEDQSISGRRELLQRILASVRAALDGPGDRTAAAAELRAAIVLYAADSVVQQQVAECRQLLEQLGDTAERE